MLNPTDIEFANKYDSAVEDIRRTAYELTTFISNDAEYGKPSARYSRWDEDNIFDAIKRINAAKRAFKVIIDS